MDTNRSLGLSHIRITKQKLLTTLRHNREVYLKEYNEALKEYYDALVFHYKCKFEEAKSYEDDVENVLDINTSFDLIKPKSYVDKYDLIIDMLECSVNSFVDITEGEYRRYIKDEWDWTNQFNVVKMAYSS